MVNNQNDVQNQNNPYKLILPALFISIFSSATPNILTGLLLIDIGQTFASPIGVIGQIQTLSSAIAVVTSLLTGIFSVRFRQKSLLIYGLVFLAISSLGCGFAVNIGMMFIVFSISGFGRAMVVPMATALIAEHFSLERRSNAMGWLIAGGSLSYLVGSPVIILLGDVGGWRLAFIGYSLPLLLLGILLVWKNLPSVEHNPSIGGTTYLEGFEHVLSNKSAVACLIGAVMASICWQGLVYYSVSFFRRLFLIPVGWAAMIISFLAMSFTFGSLLSGRIVNRYGRKSLTVIGALFAGLSVISYTMIPLFWLSIAVALIGCFFSGIRYTAANSLSLEQVPSFRGTMMSLNSAAISFGLALGAAIGGMALIWYDWNILGMVLGVIGVVAAIVYYIFTKDRTARAVD